MTRSRDDLRTKRRRAKRQRAWELVGRDAKAARRYGLSLRLYRVWQAAIEQYARDTERAVVIEGDYLESVRVHTTQARGLTAQGDEA